MPLKVKQERLGVFIRVPRDLYDFVKAAAEAEDRTIANFSQRLFAAEVERLKRAKASTTRLPEQRSA